MYALLSAARAGQHKCDRARALSPRSASLSFFRSNWNTFDFVCVAASYAALAELIEFNPTVLRLLRLLRVLKMVKRFPQLQVIVNALIMGLGSIAYIALILFFFFYLFAIIGVNEFGDNDPWHFGSLHIAMLTLYRCSTLEDWTDVMYINMYGCDRWSHYTGGFEHLCVAPVAKGYTAALFFICFVILGALVLLTLFVGVVTTGMDEAQEAQNYENEMNKKIAEIVEKEEIAENVVANYCQVFAMLDLDGGGSIEEEELRLGLRQIGREPSDTELAALLLTVDEDGSGAIDMAEFVQFMVNMKKKSHERKEMLRSGVKKVMQMSKITSAFSAPKPAEAPEEPGVVKQRVSGTGSASLGSFLKSRRLSNAKDGPASASNTAVDGGAAPAAAPADGAAQQKPAPAPSAAEMTPLEPLDASADDGGTRPKAPDAPQNGKGTARVVPLS